MSFAVVRDGSTSWIPSVFDRLAGRVEPVGAAVPTGGSGGAIEALTVGGGGPGDATERGFLAREGFS
jgi:hypothetical protein